MQNMTNKQAVKVCVNGALGKMGSRIVALARDDARFDVVAALDLDDIARAEAMPTGSFDVIIDFSSPDGALHATALAQKHHAALLIGTTGLSRQTWDALDAASKSCAVMIAPNTSRGVAVLSHLVAQAAQLLGPEFDISLTESHHAMKRDAPSGTALRLGQALREKGGVDFQDAAIRSIRAGDTIGEHTIQFASPAERLVIKHSATSRDLFARGALHAAAWLCRKPPGKYSIEQSLGLL